MGAGLKKEDTMFPFRKRKLSDLEKRKHRGDRLRRRSPKRGYCYRCHIPWNYTPEKRGHVTYYGEEGEGCFPLCERCWAQLSPEQRLPFYEFLFVEGAAFGYPTSKEKADVIREAVRAGK